MGYRVRKVPYGIGWKLAYEKYDSSGRHFKDIPRDEWAALGFNATMSIESAKQRSQSLNSQEKLKRVAETRNAIRDKLRTERDTFTAFLPPNLLNDFEKKLTSKELDKWQSHWRAAQRVIVKLSIDVSEWAANSESFYGYFRKQKWSPSYVQKILYILNEWGKFYSRTLKVYFEPIPAPRGRNKQRIADEYFDSSGGGQKSDPITPSQLISSALKPEHHNWLYLTIWFGLRPGEVDLLWRAPGPTTWEIKAWKHLHVLSIYQSKLKTIERARRYKSIPCVRPEQVNGLDIIRNGLFRRPLCKTLRSHFNERVTCYAGRNGFVSLMLGFGYPLEKISRWMGHQSIERTWKSYTDKNEDLV